MHVLLIKNQFPYMRTTKTCQNAQQKYLCDKYDNNLYWGSYWQGNLYMRGYLYGGQNGK